MNSELLNLIENAPKVTLGDYIVRVERTNSAGAYGAEDGYQTQKASWRLEQILKDAR